MLNSYISISKNKLFVFSAVCLLSLFIVLHFLYFENFTRQVIKNDRSTKNFHFIKKEGANIKIACIGTSHTGDAIKMHKNFFFNYARSSTWYPQVAYAKVSHLLTYAPNLKVLLLEVDHISILSYDPTLHTTMPDQYLYLLKHVDKPLYEENNLELDDREFTLLYSLNEDVAPVIHRKYFQSYLMGQRHKNEEVSPWSTLTSKEKITSARKRTHSYHIDTPSNIDNAVHDYYLKAIKEAKNKGINVYLLFNPQTKEYLDQISPDNHILVDAFVFKLSEIENVKVLDYRHLFDVNESLFENQDHVNKNGSAILTKKVVYAIKNDL